MTTFEESMQMSMIYLTNTFNSNVSVAFLNYIEEEEIEEIEVIKNDIKKDASTSIIVEFMGDKFEWNDEEKQSFFSALHKLFDITIKKPSDIDWTYFTENDIRETREYLNKQCFNAFSCLEQSFLTIEAIGRNHDINIVPLLYDVYSHYKMCRSYSMSKQTHAKLVFGYIHQIEHLLPFYSTYYNIPSPIKVICFGYYYEPPKNNNYNNRNVTHSQFCQKSKILHSLTKKESTRQIYDSIIQTLNRFSHRSFIEKFNIYSCMKIDDDINIYIKYTLYISNMLDNIIRNNHSCLPLLVDLWIIPLKVKELLYVYNNSDSDDDSDSGSDSQSDDYSDYEMKDTIPLNFHEGLKKYNAYYCMDTINYNEEKKCIQILKTQFEKILNKSRRSIKIGIIIDRRKEQNNLLIYQLPLKYSAIPRNYCNETLIFSSGHHLMYDIDNSILKVSRKRNEEKKIEPIFGTKFDCDGKMFCLSFSLLETNINRIQFWQNGGGMRFWPDYMLNIWPKLFISPKIEEKYSINDYIKNNFKLNVDDTLFDLWYKSIVDWQ